MINPKSTHWVITMAMVSSGVVGICIGAQAIICFQSGLEAP